MARFVGGEKKKGGGVTFRPGEVNLWAKWGSLQPRRVDVHVCSLSGADLTSLRSRDEPL